MRSGIGLIRGWACTAGRVEVSIDDGPLLATAHGTDRPDTAETCGRTNTGFGLIYNWNRLGDGIHNLRAFADGQEFANVNFSVATLGGEFLSGLQGSYSVRNFPQDGVDQKIRWSQAHQNFVFVSPVAVPPVDNPPSRPTAALESPTQESSESGIGLIRGWVCEASRVEVSIDGGPLLATAHGTDRPDTEAVCGRADTGFGLTYNWNLVGDGVHNLRAFADGVEFANVNFAVATLGSEFVTGLLAKLRLLGFPGTGTNAAVQADAETEPTTTVQWSEPDQNFVISTSTASGEKLAIVSALTDLRNKMALLGVGAQPASATNSFGVQAPKNAQGQPTGVDALSWADLSTGVWADLRLGPDGLPDLYRDSTGRTARLERFTETTVDVSFLDNGGQVEAGPLTTLFDGHLLRVLQRYVDQVRAATPSPAVAALPTATTTDALRLSLNALMVNLLWSGGSATGETLCALRAAADAAGIDGLIAPTACQSPLLANWVARATAPEPQVATTMASGIDPQAQQALQFAADVEMPCEEANDSAACLTPAATELDRRERESVPEERPDPIAPISVPNVVGLSQSAAVAALQEAGLRVGTVRREASSTVPVGNVISQTPAARVLVQPGTAVDLVVSSGSGTVAVPNVVGLSESAAATEIRNAGLTVGAVTRQTSATVPAGNVIRQNPAAGSSVALGSAVDLVVSSGSGAVAVPNVVGLSESAAATEIRNAGLTVGAVSREHSETVPAGNVIRQNPAAGSSVAPGSAVDLVVSGPAPGITYLVTGTAGPGGNISPSSQTVEAGARTSLAVTPDRGYEIDSVTGCGGSLDGSTYFTGPINADCTVTATFRPQILTVTATSVGCDDGFISPATQRVNYGDTASFTVSPGLACYIISVTGCGGSLDGSGILPIYTTGPITGNCTVTASFGLDTPPPSANDDAVTIQVGQSVTIAVLANDTGTGLTIVQVGSPSSGTASISGSAVVYTPETGFVAGTDGFSYTIRDDLGRTDTANVTVTVSSPLTPPTGINIIP